MPFYSGAGSHDPAISTAYITAARVFLRYFELIEGRKANVADLGCGDFWIGSQVRPSCAGYIACDIAPSVIEFNKKHFKDLDVDFRQLNLIKDELPRADVVFVRQVLQHLSNDDIKTALPKISESFKFLVLTEHLPFGAFVPNLEKSLSDEHIRLHLNSGVVLTSPPFDLQHSDEALLLEVPYVDGNIRTNIYRLS